MGSKVHLFKTGDKVITLFNQGHIAGPLTPDALGGGVGGVIDGALQQYGVYDQFGLAPMPTNLDFLEGATLCCAGLTAWNALYGIESKKLMPGDWVLTQGTGGVSVFGVQVCTQCLIGVSEVIDSNSLPKQLALASSQPRLRMKRPRSSRSLAQTMSSTTRRIRLGARPPRRSLVASAWTTSLRSEGRARCNNRSRLSSLRVSLP